MLDRPPEYRQVVNYIVIRDEMLNEVNTGTSKKSVVPPVWSLHDNFDAAANEGVRALVGVLNSEDIKGHMFR